MLGLSAKLVLSNLKVKQLSDSLGDEKKRKKRKRKITEELRASGQSGALFMSPSKIQIPEDPRHRIQQRAREGAVAAGQRGQSSGASSREGPEGSRGTEEAR